MFFGQNFNPSATGIAHIPGIDQTQGNATSAVLVANTTGANFLCMSVSSSTGVSAIIDSLNATGWTKVVTEGTGPSNELWYIQNPVVGAGHSITVNGAFLGVCLLGFSGLVLTSTLESFAHNSTFGGTTGQGGSVTPGTGQQLIIATCGGTLFGTPDALTIDSGFSTPVFIALVGGLNYAAAVSYLIQSGAAPTNPTWTSNPPSSTVFSCINGVFQGL